MLTFLLAGVFLVSSFWQASNEKKRLSIELERNAALIADSLGEAVRPLLADKAYDALADVARDFSNRQALVGITVSDAQGRFLTASSSLGKLPDKSTETLRQSAGSALQGGHPAAAELTVNGDRAHAYVNPLRIGKKDAYALAVIHSSEYIYERLRRIWILNTLRFGVLTLLVTGAALATLYLNVLAPVRRTADWIRRVRLGEVTPERPRDDARFLQPLANEVSKLAVSLVRAREAAEEEARLRQSSESLWTPERLKEFVRVKLQGRPLFVVSNREPYQHLWKGKEIECVVPASGLVTAIEPVLKACGGTWVAEGNGDADRQTVDENDRLRVPPDEPQYTLRRVWLSREEEEGYYYGFSNEGLWPLCHVAHNRPIFREKDWAMYESVNRKFADALLQELEGTSEPGVLIQDYHFALLPKLIKEKRPDARVAIFWHIPWPNPESFGICPWQNELLGGMLGADIVGFHTQYHCNHFLQTVDRALESRIDYEHFTVSREGHTTSVKPFPISIAFLGGGSTERDASMPDKDALLKAYGLAAEYLGVGVDRLDYTKGILERFRAVEAFLDKYPQFVGRFTFAELAAPSRSLIPKYQEFEAEVEREAERVNARWREKSWKPILLLKRHHSQKDIAPFYRAADVCLVTSLHDGMNLVAKEYVSARSDERGVLVLSQFTGAARELRDALIVNPYDAQQVAESIRAALHMPAGEQAERMRRMREVLKERNIYRWAADIIQELTAVRLDLQTAERPFAPVP